MKWVKDRTGRFAQRPHYLPQEIDDECERLIQAFLKKKYGKIEYPIKTDDLTVLIEEKADLDSYADLSGEQGEVEGVTEFVPRKRPIVRISGALSAPKMENRLRTTLTHEFGHVHFHQFMFDDIEIQPPSLFSNHLQGHTNKCNRENMIGASERNWMEWQAGYACGAILMPASALIATIRRFRAEKNVPFTSFAVDAGLGEELIAAVSAAFQTSLDAARVRLLKKNVFAGSAATPTFELF